MRLGELVQAGKQFYAEEKGACRCLCLAICKYPLTSIDVGHLKLSQGASLSVLNSFRIESLGYHKAGGQLQIFHNVLDEHRTLGLRNEVHVLCHANMIRMDLFLYIHVSYYELWRALTGVDPL